VCLGKLPIFSRGHTACFHLWGIHIYILYIYIKVDGRVYNSRTPGAISTKLGTRMSIYGDWDK
jgi:hypothetical protein